MAVEIPDIDRKVSAFVVDWSREACSRWEWNPGRQLIRSIRRYQAAASRGGLLGRIGKAYWARWHRFWSVVSGAEIPVMTKIGGGLLLPHPNGIVIHPSVEIGINCLIFQQATLGHGGPIPGVPRLGAHVDVGAGARLLGGITVGSHAQVGANSVVLVDVPPLATAVGMPARILPRRPETPDG